jgi:uncharacterized membrane protein YeaQ/YmgE (transglycosylase-associated protein family)
MQQAAENSLNSDRCMIGLAIRRAKPEGDWSMDLQWMTVVALIVGGIAGWALAKVLRRKGFALVSFIVVGVIGGWAGNFLWGFIHKGEGFDPYTLASSAAGGIVLVMLWRLVR